MEITHIIDCLAENKLVFKALFERVPKPMYKWKVSEDKWNILELLVHLYDEEIEDFRFRTSFALANNEELLPAINPEGWVKERKYNNRDYKEVLKLFLDAREESILWLNNLRTPDWSMTAKHPEYGSISAQFFLENWLAHDYLHIQQLNRMKYQYFRIMKSNVDLNYAGPILI